MIDLNPTIVAITINVSKPNLHLKVHMKKKIKLKSSSHHEQKSV